MRLSALGLFYIGSSLATIQAGIIARNFDNKQIQTDEIIPTNKADRSLEYSPNSGMNSKCNSKSYPNLSSLNAIGKSKHRFHQKYSKDTWRSDYQANKDDRLHAEVSQKRIVNDATSVRSSNGEIQTSKDSQAIRDDIQHTDIGSGSEVTSGTSQALNNIDSVEIILKKGVNSENGHPKIKEIEINFHSSKAESAHSEGNIAVDIVAGDIEKEVIMTKVPYINDDSDSDETVVTDDFLDAEPRNPVLSNLSSPPSHRGFRTGIPDDQIEAEDPIGGFGSPYL
ncbi:hypothetical protein K7432_006486 [Basidiobolus ranarum]|uniref:Uncharacterized protein n=1 Tax=Basidiobolus ranarum TaxID=34480 RepID=A0ABR2WUX3_9FUNG